jgi:Peptidase C13 family
MERQQEKLAPSRTRRPSRLAPASPWRRGLIALLLVAAAASGRPAAAEAGGKTFALVINGDGAAKHRQNVSLALDALVGLGLDEDRIYVLSGSPQAPQPGPRAVHYLRPTWASLRGVTKALSAAMGGEDTLVVYTTGHGAWEGGVPVLVLPDETVSARELSRRLLAIPFGRLLFVADQCYSGAFARDLQRSRRNVVAISSTDAAHEVLCTHFARPFWKALGRSGGGDGGRITDRQLNEAFALAVESQRVAAPREQPRAQLLTSRVGREGARAG